MTAAPAAFVPSLGQCFDLFGQYLGSLRAISLGYQAENGYLRAAMQAAVDNIAAGQPVGARQVLEYALSATAEAVGPDPLPGNVIRLRPEEGRQ